MRTFAKKLSSRPDSESNVEQQFYRPTDPWQTRDRTVIFGQHGWSLRLVWGPDAEARRCTYFGRVRRGAHHGDCECGDATPNRRRQQLRRAADGESRRRRPERLQLHGNGSGDNQWYGIVLERGASLNLNGHTITLVQDQSTISVVRCLRDCTVYGGTITNVNASGGGAIDVHQHGKLTIHDVTINRLTVGIQAPLAKVIATNVSITAEAQGIYVASRSSSITSTSHSPA